MLPTFKPWEELTISDNYMFQLVMREPKLCQHLIETILQIKIKEISFPDYEKTISLGLESKSVRLDVYVKDDEGRVYDIEMQCANRGRRNLAMRSRIYQSMIDAELLERGAHYETLNPTFVIFICTFDLFGAGEALYRFSTHCDAIHDIILEDDEVRIFLNSKGSAKAKNPELAAFLRYVDGQAAEGRFAQEVNQAVCKVKSLEGRRREYMYLYQEMEWLKQEAAKEAVKEDKQVTAEKFLAMGIEPEKVAEGTGLPLAEVRKLAYRTKQIK